MAAIRELCSNHPMTKDEITAWALSNGWQIVDGMPSLTKPAPPHPAIVRLVLKATVANLEIKKPAGKWKRSRARITPRSQPIRKLVCPMVLASPPSLASRY